MQSINSVMIFGKHSNVFNVHEQQAQRKKGGGARAQWCLFVDRTACRTPCRCPATAPPQPQALQGCANRCLAPPPCGGSQTSSSTPPTLSTNPPLSSTIQVAWARLASPTTTTHHVRSRIRARRRHLQVPTYLACLLTRPSSQDRPVHPPPPGDPRQRRPAGQAYPQVAPAPPPQPRPLALGQCQLEPPPGRLARAHGYLPPARRARPRIR